jgi:putative addiction module component (TIGR02574 family)
MEPDRQDRTAGVHWRCPPLGKTVVSPTLEQFGLDALSLGDRLTLAQALWDSVHDALDREPVAPAVRAELERRAALADADPSRGTPWEAVRAAARARWAQ